MDVWQIGLNSGMQQRQVGNQALKLLMIVRAKLLLFLTLSNAVRSVVVGAMFRLSNSPTTAALVLALLFLRLRTVFSTCLRQSRLKFPYALHRWHWLDEDAAIAAPRHENTGSDALRDCWST